MLLGRRFMFSQSKRKRFYIFFNIWQYIHSAIESDLCRFQDPLQQTAQQLQLIQIPPDIPSILRQTNLQSNE